MSKSQIGLIGLATMGANLARNIANKGFRVSVFNRTTEKTEQFIKDFGKESAGRIHGSTNLKEFIASLETPRKIILLVKAGAKAPCPGESGTGQPVDDVIAELSPLLDKNDILIDCGNSHFKDTERRQNSLTTRDLNFIGCGISGGEEGALNGPSLMPGGKKSAYEKIHPILEKIAARDFSKNPCVVYIGPGGSGHFVKMVHNGIEYAIMQVIAEAYDILRRVGKFSNPELSKIFANYNKNPNLKSFLLEITTKIFTKKEDGKYIIDYIKDAAGQKGTGKWTTEIAHDLGIYIPAINMAVDARIVSGETQMRAMSQSMLKQNLPSKKLSPSGKKNLIKQVENALELAIILCYEQGIALISKSAKEFKWNLNFAEIIRVWQGGCIIRSGYLKDLALAFSTDKKIATKTFQKIMKNLAGEKQKNWRKLMSLAIENGIPVPSFYACLNYFDSYAAKNLPQNLIQAQRDFFGAHGYERTDKPGSFHTEWN